MNTSPESGKPWQPHEMEVHRRIAQNYPVEQSLQNLPGDHLRRWLATLDACEAERVHFKNLNARIRQAGEWENEFDNTPYLVACMRAERDAYRGALELLSAKLTWDPAAPGAKDVLKIREMVLKVLREWP